MYTKFRIIPLFAVVLISGLMLSLSLRKKPETWHSEPDKSTSKIRLITHLEKNALQKQFIRKILQRGLSIDTVAMSSSAGHLWTTVDNSESFCLHFLFETDDSVETISGEFGSPGPNTIREGLKANLIAWKKITFDGKGWSDLTTFAQMEDSVVILYNSTIQKQ